MLSKCANPECPEKFLFLHLGKLFCLGPTPEIEASAGALSLPQERFRLCDRCAKIMTIVWDGTKARSYPCLKPQNQRRQFMSQRLSLQCARGRRKQALSNRQFDRCGMRPPPQQLVRRSSRRSTSRHQAWTIFSSAGRFRITSVEPLSCSSCRFLKSENNRLTVSRVVPMISAISS